MGIETIVEVSVAGILVGVSAAWMIVTIGGGNVAVGDAGAVEHAARKIYNETKIDCLDNILKLYRKPTIDDTKRNRKIKIGHENKMI